MKHFFLINPAAGKGKHCRRLEAEITDYCTSHGLEYEVYYTKGVGDAEKFIRQTCGNMAGEIRFYACGGDGTVCEAVNGVSGFPNATVGVIPIGTGNDFVRNFTQHEKFLDIKDVTGGSTVRVDLIKYNGRYAANTLNTGFDAEVVKTVIKIKRNPAVPAKLAYVLGALWQLIRKPGVKIRVSVDGGPVEEKNLLLTCIGNGAYCGGGFNSGPYVSLNDGLLDVCFIKNVSRLKFLLLLGSYKKGTYLSRRGIGEIAEYIKCRKIDIEFARPQSVSVDGELVDLDRLTVESAAGELGFCLPEGCEIIKPPDCVICPAVRKYAGELGRG